MTSGRHSTPSLLSAILRKCAEEEGGRRALAGALGISPQTLYDLLSGHAPGRHVQRAVAGYLEVRAEDVRQWASTRET